ncbi:hypothetical protein TrST_g12525 [Triparma strigata]|uniref:CRAL-TRIO domain-containing protein n=1 Tax=Triparma strigata TaxID=1606541 RepID=A0A9W7B0M7_9STRA|nr:hypothetical protein TrST_g12525 [Triparma strigata]
MKPPPPTSALSKGHPRKSIFRAGAGLKIIFRKLKAVLGKTFLFILPNKRRNDAPKPKPSSQTLTSTSTSTSTSTQNKPHNLTEYQYNLLYTFQENLLPLTPPSHESVPWGGPNPLTPTHPFTPLDLHLLESYLTVQSYPSSLLTTWPPSQCSSTPCPSSFSYLNTLKWRQTYRPFSLPPSLKSEASDGWLYTRSTTLPPKQPLIFYRPGLHKPESLESYIRNVIYNLERAAAVASENAKEEKYLGGKGRSDPRRYFFILDASGFTFSMIPSMSAVKKLFSMVGDHYPRRLGKLVIVNAGRASMVFWGMLKVLIPEDVKSKITIIGARENAREYLIQDIGVESIPDWLGGEDTWRYDVEEYLGEVDWTDEEAKAFMETNKEYCAEWLG